MADASFNHVSNFVVVGGGAGGIELITRLAKTFDPTRARLTLVDESPTHFWKPRLHEIAAGLIGAADDQVSFLAHARRYGYEFAMGRLDGIDMDRRLVVVDEVRNVENGDIVLPRRAIPYDRLVLAFGSRVNDFGTPGVAENCHMLDSPELAAKLQRQIFEAALKASSSEESFVRVGIVGAGATGVELAAELHHAFSDLKRFGGIEARNRLSITLLDMADRVLPATDPRTGAHALETLRRIGVKVRLKTGVARANGRGFELSDGSFLPCDIRVWAAGITGLDIAGRLGLPSRRDGRIIVDPDLSCTTDDSIYAIGDCAAAPGQEPDSFLPPTAQVAHQQASYLASAFRLNMIGRSIQPFKFHPKGTLVSLGRSQAAAEIPDFRSPSTPIAMTGQIAKLLYVSLEQMHRAAIWGWPRAIALMIADRLRGTTVPPVKLH